MAAARDGQAPPPAGVEALDAVLDVCVLDRDRMDAFAARLMAAARTD